MYQVWSMPKGLLMDSTEIPETYDKIGVTYILPSFLPQST